MTTNSKEVKNIIAKTENSNADFLNLQKENEQLKKQLQAIPESFDLRLDYFKQKQELIYKFSKLEDMELSLKEHHALIEELKLKDDFLNDEYRLSINMKNGYSSEKELFRLKNPVIISEVLNYVMVMIDNKKQEYKKQIEN